MTSYFLFSMGNTCFPLCSTKLQLMRIFWNFSFNGFVKVGFAGWWSGNLRTFLIFNSSKKPTKNISFFAIRSIHIFFDTTIFWLGQELRKSFYWFFGGYESKRKNVLRFLDLQGVFKYWNHHLKGLVLPFACAPPDLHMYLPPRYWNLTH